MPEISGPGPYEREAIGLLNRASDMAGVTITEKGQT